MQRAQWPTSTASEQRSAARSPNVRWQESPLTRPQRWLALGRRGATIWFTGLPGAGKSTVAAALENRLVLDGRPALLLDGDNLRHGLNGDLGFGESARRENVRRTAHVAMLLAESGTLALVSLVSPFAADREIAAQLHETAGLEMLEVFVDAPLALCEERDPKGLYARARAGDLRGMTGVDSPYEPPPAADVVLRPQAQSVEDEVTALLYEMDARGLLSAQPTDRGRRRPVGGRQRP